MDMPFRFVVTTYNIWADNRWPQREPALRAYVEASGPDILALQELRPVTRELLDQILPDHQRVDDDFEGWIREGNLYWSTRRFELVEYGAEPIGMKEKSRRLFWARLRIKGTEQSEGRTIFVSTAHYTYQGHPDERATGQSPRLDQARRTLEALDRLAPPEEPALFMGDLNDPVNAMRILREGGLRDSFEAMGLRPQVTWPTIPTANDGPNKTVQVLDWQFHRGPLRVMNTQVVDFYHGDLAPSDHKPVTVTYGWGDPQPPGNPR